MKQLILPLFTLVTCASTAQLSMTPQVGVETFKTTIQSGNFSSFSPMGQQPLPSLAVRMAYSLKSGQGVFLGVATSSPAVELQFANPQNAQTLYSASTKNLQLRLEGGYQFTSKPITLRKSVSTNNNTSSYVQRSSGAKQSGCYRSMCGRMKNPASDYTRTAASKMTRDNGLYMRIKPSMGLAIAPTGNKMETQTKAGQMIYTYGAGLNTALIAGTAFEIGTRNSPKLMVSVNYLRSLGDNTQTVSNSELLKPAITTFSSKTSGFNINVGVPFNLKKKTPAVQYQQPAAPSHYGHCGRYRFYEL